MAPSLEPLRRYLAEQGLASGEPIAVAPLSGGQSNPTFFVEASGKRMVLRKKPPGVLLASAHAIDREFRVMGALRGRGVPVPRMLVYCEDTSIVGTPFYLMEFVEGRVLVDQSLPGMTPDERKQVYGEMCRNLAALHQIDWRAAGLESFGREGNYFQRQIGRWTRQCEASTLPLPPAMRRLMEWLPAHVPRRERTSLLHGDWRLDNLIFHPTQPQVIAVLDWELSTLGDPLADLSYQCMAWHIPASLWRGVAGLDLPARGIPSEAEYLSIYREATGEQIPEDWNFYLAFNLFRMAAILHGIAERAAAGNATASNALETGLKAGPIAEIGWDRAIRL